MSYPIMDIALLYVVVSAVLFGGRRDTSNKLIGLAVSIMLAGDFVYDLMELHNAYSDGNLVDATWLLNYLLLGVAALHPSMTNVGSTRPVTAPPRLWWLVMVGLATLITPILLLVSSAFGVHLDLPVIAGAAFLMGIIASFRMVGMFGRLRRRTSDLRRRTESLEMALQERDALENDLRHQAFHDGLTGLANRALLQERLEQALARKSRDQSEIVLVMCDLDGFKAVNDSLGHQVGDALLVAVADRLASVVRPGAPSPGSAVTSSRCCWIAFVNGRPGTPSPSA
jgi:hypothetical protein